MIVLFFYNVKLIFLYVTKLRNNTNNESLGKQKKQLVDLRRNS